ncbi:putative ribonuclease H-like domain-containing protein [Tanacetum coccineum]
MTGNKSYLSDYEEIDGGFIAFGGNPKGGRITGKGKINIGGLTCLFAKATLDESNLWNRRLGHINFKTLNKLVRGNLVRGLPSKIFENHHTCVSCQKGKQHKASCKTKTISSISQPLQMLHMDLFGPTFVKSLMKNVYCLVVTDDYIRFSWVFFLATKDETSEILKTFITGIENLIDLMVKVIRCDNGTEFKNKVMNQFCEMKGIKREFSVARTPQQNRVAKRRNMTLINAARTILADSKLPTIFWAEAVNTACYVTKFVCLDHLGKFPRYRVWGKADEGDYFPVYTLLIVKHTGSNEQTVKKTPNIAGIGNGTLIGLFDIDVLLHIYDIIKPVFARKSIMLLCLANIVIKVLMKNDSLMDVIDESKFGTLIWKRLSILLIDEEGLVLQKADVPSYPKVSHLHANSVMLELVLTGNSTTGGSGLRCQDTILGDAEAQIRFEAASKKSMIPTSIKTLYLTWNMV